LVFSAIAGGNVPQVAVAGKNKTTKLQRPQRLFVGVSKILVSENQKAGTGNNSCVPAFLI
jgi:hypothetical protein